MSYPIPACRNVRTELLQMHSAKNKIKNGCIKLLAVVATILSVGNTGALNPEGMGFGNDSDSQVSITKAGMSQANIAITNEAKQKELTDKDTTQTVAELNRNVATDKDTSGALTNKFDATRVQNEVDAQTQITQTFGQQAAQAIGTIAQNQAKKHKEQAQDLKEKAADQHNNLSHDER